MYTMSDEKDDQENSELNEQLLKIIKNGVENLNILENEAVRDLLEKKRVANAPYAPLFTDFMEILLLDNINPEEYDRKLNMWMGSSSFTFFSEIKQLFNVSRQQNPPMFNQLLSKFLHLVAIKQIKKTHINLVQRGLMEDRTLDLEEDFKEKHTIDYSELANKINQKLEEVKERGKKLEQLETNVAKQAQLILKLINDYLQTSRYFIGLLVALLDMYYNRLEDNIDNYFSYENSYSLLYRKFGYQYNKKIKRYLKHYLTKTKFRKSLKSVKTVFESFVLNEFKDLRIHVAHTESDVEQNQLKERIYKVRVNGLDKSYTLDEFKNLWEIYFNFFQNFKFLVAREFFNDDRELVRYIENRPEPVVFHIYPGKPIGKR